jgi:hypothetical protein
LLSLTSSIELGVVFVLVPDCLLNFVLRPTIAILSTVPLLRMTSDLSELKVRTFPLSRPILAFWVSATPESATRESTIPNPVRLGTFRIGFSFQLGLDHLIETRADVQQRLGKPHVWECMLAP